MSAVSGKGFDPAFKFSWEVARTNLTVAIGSDIKPEHASKARSASAKAGEGGVKTPPNSAAVTSVGLPLSRGHEEGRAHSGPSGACFRASRRDFCDALCSRARPSGYRLRAASNPALTRSSYTTAGYSLSNP